MACRLHVVTQHPGRRPTLAPYLGMYTANYNAAVRVYAVLEAYQSLVRDAAMNSTLPGDDVQREVLDTGHDDAQAQPSQDSCSI